MTTQYNDETKSVESFAMRSFEAGEEVTICYGNRPNYELFVHNGFIFTDNPFDRMKIPLGKLVTFKLVLLLSRVGRQKVDEV